MRIGIVVFSRSKVGGDVPGGDEGRSPDRHRNAWLRMKTGFGDFLGGWGEDLLLVRALGGSGSPPGRRLLLLLRMKTRIQVNFASHEDTDSGEFCFA